MKLNLTFGAFGGTFVFFAAAQTNAKKSKRATQPWLIGVSMLTPIYPAMAFRGMKVHTYIPRYFLLRCQC